MGHTVLWYLIIMETTIVSKFNTIRSEAQALKSKETTKYRQNKWTEEGEDPDDPTKVFGSFLN